MVTGDISNAIYTSTGYKEIEIHCMNVELIQ